VHLHAHALQHYPSHQQEDALNTNSRRLQTQTIEQTNSATSAASNQPLQTLQQQQQQQNNNNHNNDQNNQFAGSNARIRRDASSRRWNKQQSTDTRSSTNNHNNVQDATNFRSDWSYAGTIAPPSLAWTQTLDYFGGNVFGNSSDIHIALMVSHDTQPAADDAALTTIRPINDA
jgi:hypothetical protein